MLIHSLNTRRFLIFFSFLEKDNFQAEGQNPSSGLPLLPLSHTEKALAFLPASAADCQNSSWRPGHLSTLTWNWIDFSQLGEEGATKALKLSLPFPFSSPLPRAVYLVWGIQPQESEIYLKRYVPERIVIQIWF